MISWNSIFERFTNQGKQGKGQANSKFCLSTFEIAVFVVLGIGSLLDSMGFMTHMTVLWATLLVIYHMHQKAKLTMALHVKNLYPHKRWKLDSLQTVASLLLIFSWAMVGQLYQIEGIIKIMISLSLTVAIVDFVWESLLAGTILFLGIIYIAVFTFAFEIIPKCAGIFGILCILPIFVYWVQRSHHQSNNKQFRPRTDEELVSLQKKTDQVEISIPGNNQPVQNELEAFNQAINEMSFEKLSKVRVMRPVIQGVFIAPGVAFCIAFFAIWVLLSMNPFWQRAPEVTKYLPLSHLGQEFNLDARVLKGVDEVEPLTSNLTFPVIIKPNICTTNSSFIQKCNDTDCLKEYINGRMTHEIRAENSWLVQKYHKTQEAVVFYYKFPYMSRGYIKSIGEREDARDIGNATLLSAYWFHSSFDHIITPELEDFFNSLADKFPGYNGGRYDVMIDDINGTHKGGKGINVIEMNIFPLDAIEEKQDDTLINTFRRMRTRVMQFWIGISSILGGYSVTPVGLVKNLPRLVERAFHCANHECLFAIP